MAREDAGQEARAKLAAVPSAVARGPRDVIFLVLAGFAGDEAHYPPERPVGLVTSSLVLSGLPCSRLFGGLRDATRKCFGAGRQADCSVVHAGDIGLQLVHERHETEASRYPKKGAPAFKASGSRTRSPRKRS